MDSTDDSDMEIMPRLPVFTLYTPFESEMIFPTITVPSVNSMRLELAEKAAPGNSQPDKMNGRANAIDLFIKLRFTNPIPQRQAIKEINECRCRCEFISIFSCA